MSDEFLVERRDGIAVATFNRPRARNALTYRMYEGLADLCRAADADEEIRAIVVTGAGGHFAAGTDIAQFRALRSADDALAYEARIARVLEAIEGCRAPTIAAIPGACTGGGAVIAACCDLRIGAEDARIGWPIARTLGNCLSGANYARLAALIGAGRVIDLVFTARLMEADEARAIGLLSEVVAPEALSSRAEALARLVAGHAPLTLRATREALRRLRGAAAADDLVVQCYTSEDFREGIEAFLAKRPPRWRGR